ncbi:glycosyltransferase family 8 protein [Selenomonadales bacterium OttesenSCG-928-I06]|nr:glycosyltransferase family 8 protein [Selenomonadales bacterium OttesenSCG-928-I06]
MDIERKILENVRLTHHFYRKDEKQFNRKIVVGFGSNEKFLRPTVTAITSLVVNNKETFFVVNIFVDKISNEGLSKLNQLINMYGNFEIKIYTVNPTIFDKIYIRSQFTIAAYFRIIMPIILSDEDFILYMDSDVVCLKEISEVFNIRFNLKNKIVAAINDIEATSEKQGLFLNIPKKDYFNSGILIIDIKAWNDYNITQSVFEILLQKSSIFNFPDQDALNLALHGKVYYLGRKWNYFNDFKKSLLGEIIFYHFANNPKPWKSWYANTDKQKLYLKYEKMSPFKKTPLEKLQKDYRIARKHMRMLLKKGKILSGIKWLIIYRKLKKKEAGHDGFRVNTD